jgi:hypothetical protein
MEAANYRKRTLEESRVSLQAHCEASLKMLPYDVRIAAMLEFGTICRKVRTPFSFCANAFLEI